MEGSKRESLSSIGSTDEKKRRSRRRKLQASLCSQLEFYFSDANLRKDRFLNQMISKSSDRYVPLILVASFNKIQSLTDDIEVIAKALQRSKVVELSPDGTKIRRRKPLEEPKYDPDDCTVYVECLPRTADIAWIQKTFKYCGNVVYVSLPRYQSTGDIKGFAFVEYENPEEAQRACKLLNNPLDIYGTPGMFPKTRKGKFVNIDLSQMSLEHKNTKGLKEGSKQRPESESGNHSKKHLKRKHPEEDGENDKDEKQLKQVQEENVNNGLHRDKKATISKQEKRTTENEENRKKRRYKCEINIKESDGKKKKKHHRDEDHTKGNKEDDERREDVQSKDDKHGCDEDRKSRKRRANIDSKDFHQKKRKVREDEEGGEVLEASKNKKIKTPADNKDYENKKKKRYRQKKEKEEKQELFLRVLSKAEWLKLKDQYLHLQKQGLQEMKNAMRAQWKSKVKANNQQGKPPVTQEAHKEASAPDFVQGVVLRIQSTEPIKSRKDFREKLEATAPVAYVDLEDGDTGGFVRFKFQQAAEKVLSQEIDGLEAISFTLLTGDEENKYWKKLNSDWKSKLSSNAKRKKKRGKARVLQRAERAVTTSKMSTHITFNDEEH